MSRFKALFYLLVVIVSVLLVLYGVNMFPAPGTDSRVFIPTALLYSKGLGLTNPFYDISFVFGNTGIANNFQFNYYVPFFPMLLGTLSKIHPGIKTIFIICSLFSATSLLLYGKTIISALPQQLSTALKFMLLCSVTYVATFLIPTVGRPENLTKLLVFLMYILYAKRKEVNTIIYNLLVCILFSIMLSAQMICFYFCFIFFLTYELLNSTDVYKTILINTLRVVAIALLFIGILSLSPIGFVNTMQAIMVHGSWALERSDRSIRLFLHYWLFAPLNFGFLFIFLLCVVFYTRSLLAQLKRSNMLQRTLIMILQLMLVYGIIKFVLYASPTVYNATQFILPLSVYLFLNILPLGNNTAKRIGVSLSMITFIAGTFILFRGFILFIDYKIDAKDYTHAKAIANDVVRNNKNVYATVNLWPLFDNPYDVKLFDDIHYKSGDIIIVQQIFMPFPKELINKCTILYDWRTDQKRKFLGIPLTNTPQGYSFVVCRIN